MASSLLGLACAACLVPTALGQIFVRDEPDAAVATSVTVDSLDFSDAADTLNTTFQGIKFGCKCYPGDPCWPSPAKWNALNATVDGQLLVNIPPGAPCHNNFTGPLGTINTYDAAKCAEVTQNFTSESWTVSQPAAELWTYATNETCRPTQNPADSCTLGYYGVYVIMATKPQHVKAGIDFARRNNVRLIVRNTGHDFLGRSTGYGALIINTHSFQQVTWIDSYSGPGSYKGSAVTLGAGVEGRPILTAGHARNPPVVVVTGECPTVGIAGGFIQGGGHGPWTTLKGFSADNVLAFEAITASGHYVTANEAQNPDLFWALKGGGPASFAVILSVTMKTFPDVRSAGATLYINSTLTTDPDVWWNGTAIFHKWSNHFVDNGLYVYWELSPMTFRARPFVGIGKTSAELRRVMQPFLDELAAKGVPFEFAIKDFPTFYDLYIDLFEDEAAGGSALTGGWMFNHEDVATNNDGIVDAFKTVLSPRADLFGFMIGHLFNPGYGAPRGSSATHPAWRNATDFVIASISVPTNATRAQKADLQSVMTNTMESALRKASTSGCTYVNEADPYQRDWQSHFWGEQYPALRALRRKWDPLGVFYATSTPGTEEWEVIEDGTRLCRKL
ncbi:b080c8bd-97fb-40e4-98c9-4cd3d3d8c9e4 [Thermothielavioides terrestris]|nr:b080c8bd-97fb-40e4-98c9-4cd3d3d8c9e4 [Thermothielavioides terrestris]